MTPLSNTSAAAQVAATVLRHAEVAPQHFRLTLTAPSIAQNAQAGQFVHILSRDRCQSDPLLRRAFSILKVHDEEHFDILYRIMGRGTSLMSRWVAEQTIDLLGPLGQPFAPLAAHSLLVGGGVGVPPLAMLASTRENQKLEALVGARTASDVLCRDDFASSGVQLRVATDDGSEGHHGFVTQLLEKRLDVLAAVGVTPTVFSCGPLPMLRLVAALCASYEVPCQVSLEESMPCGIGICNGCVVPVLGGGDDYGQYRRICVEGPVVWAQEINWTQWEGGSCP